MSKKSWPIVYSMLVYQIGSCLLGHIVYKEPIILRLPKFTPNLYCICLSEHKHALKQMRVFTHLLDLKIKIIEYGGKTESAKEGLKLRLIKNPCGRWGRSYGVTARSKIGQLASGQLFQKPTYINGSPLLRENTKVCST